MTVAESRVFAERFIALAGDLLSRVEVLICPPCTALYPLAQELRGRGVALGGQDVSPFSDAAHTAQISAALLADEALGCRYVLLGHWEVRRDRGDDDARVNAKAHRALEAGLHPLLAVGEAADRRGEAFSDLERQLPALLRGFSAEQAAGAVFMYEPEWTIGVAEPAPQEHIALACELIRAWLHERYGAGTADAARIIYGGSVTPEYAAELLRAPDIDGLGATRRGRDPQSWAQIVRLIAEAKGR